MSELPRRFYIVKHETSSKRPPPKVGEDEVLIKIIVAANRQRHYMKRGIFKTIEFSGVIVGVGPMVTHLQVGEQVCGLLEDQRCAELLAIPSWRVMRVPKGINLYDAATLPYAASVVFHSFLRVGKLKANCSIMIYNGAGEFGAMAIQLAKCYGCKVFATGRNQRELQYCKEIGADYCIKYTWGFVDYVMRQTNGTGVDFVFDPVGDKLNASWRILGQGATYLITESTHMEAFIRCNHIGRRQIKLIALSFWTLPPEEKHQIFQELIDNLWPMFESGKLVPRDYKRTRKNIFDSGSIFLDKIVSFFI